MRIVFLRIWLLSALVALIGCGGGGGSNSTTNTQPTPTLNLITVTPPSPSVTVGQTQQFKATATFSDNSTKDVTGSTTWSSSDTTIATIASSGLATSLKVGSVTITGTLQTVNGSTSLGVSASPPPQVSVSILPISVNVAAGGSQQFSASVTGSPNTAVTWEVSGIAGGNASVGTVSATGLYTAPTSAGKIVVSAVAQANQSDSGLAMFRFWRHIHSGCALAAQVLRSSSTVGTELNSRREATTIFVSRGILLPGAKIIITQHSMSGYTILLLLKML